MVESVYVPGEVRVDPFRRYVAGRDGCVMLRINHKDRDDMVVAVRARQQREVEVSYG